MTPAVAAMLAGLVPLIILILIGAYFGKLPEEPERSDKREAEQ